MKSNSELIEIIIGSWFLILTSYWFLKDPSFIYYVPLTFFFLISILINVFKSRRYQNRNLYIFFGAVFLVLIGLSLIQLSSQANNFLYCIEIGIFTLLIILLIRGALRKVGTIPKKMNPKNEHFQEC